MKKLLLIATSLVIFSAARGQNAHDRKLQKKLDDLVAGFHGQVGIYVQNLRTGKTASVNADSIFPTASMVKVPIMCGVSDKIEKGELKYNQELMYRDSLLYEGEDIVGAFKDSAQVKLSKVQMLSITTSDNTASLWLQKLVGTDYINNWLATKGFQQTRVNSRATGREAARKIYGWGQTTPREMAKLVTMIREGQAVSPAASERMYRTLTRIYWDDFSLSQIPPYVQVASKQGFVDQARSEVVLVNAPHGDYVFCIATKNQADTSYTADNEGIRMIRNLSHLLWTYYEPHYKWSSPKGIEKYTVE